MGPNAAVHLNQAHVLPRVAQVRSVFGMVDFAVVSNAKVMPTNLQVFKVVSQYLKEFPGLTRFCVRLRLWSDIVSEPKDGASNVLPMVSRFEVSDLIRWKIWKFLQEFRYSAICYRWSYGACWSLAPRRL